MTRLEATEILCYIAQDYLEPFVMDDSISDELRHKMLGEQFNKLCKFVNELVKDLPLLRSFYYLDVLRLNSKNFFQKNC